VRGIIEYIRLLPAGHRSVPKFFRSMALSNGIQFNNRCYMYARRNLSCYA
jgi:hypothetical protein